MGVERKYIYLNQGTGRYHVRVTRKGTTYNIGRYDTVEEAVVERDKFLQEYAINPPSVVINQYSREWFEAQSKMQIKLFAARGK